MSLASGQAYSLLLYLKQTTSRLEIHKEDIMSVYAFADLHGHLNLWKQIKGILQPNDVVYCLGDCGDRGPQPWETIKEVYNDQRVIYIKGNHDDMLAKAGRQYLKYGAYTYAYNLLDYNGGSGTFIGLMKEQAPEEWVEKLDNLSLEEVYVNKDGYKIFLTHAGFTPLEGRPALKDATEEDYFNFNFSDKAYLWDRSHFMQESYPYQKNTIVIHGHTPYEALKEYGVKPSKEDYPAFWYDENRKCDLDCWTYDSHQAVLLNLDTFESIIIKE